MRLISPPAPQTPWDGTPAAAQGRLGEQALIDLLACSLDDRYLVLHRLSLPGTQADLDLVVIATRIIVVEVKTYRGPRRYRCEGTVWSYADTSGEWWPLDSGPGAQAAFGAHRVRRRLANAHIAAPIQSVVAWAGDAPLTLARPRIPVLAPAALAGWLAEIKPADAAHAERIGRVLAPPAP